MTEVSKSRLIFWSRLISWLAIGCGTPIGVFAYKFGLFTQETVICDELGNVIAQTNYKLNGWGIISCILIGSFIFRILKDIADSYTGYSFIKQCYTGLIKTIPLIIAYALMYFLSGAIEQVMFCLMVLIICRIVSTPLNPMPKWKYERQGKEDYSTLTEVFTDFVKTHLKGGNS